MTPYISVVAVSRNDDHGGDPLFRTQVFVDSLAEQSERFKVAVELLLVDWNPPNDRCGLREVIRWPKRTDFFSARVVEVPPSIHRSIRGAAALPLFQMIGKNVGIRRASGRFVLATNIDIVFSDELFAVLSEKTLREGRLYRCDRYDSQSGVPHPASPQARQDYLRTHCIRRNRRFGPPDLVDIGEHFSDTRLPELVHSRWVSELSMSGVIPIVTLSQDCPPEYLHTNGCGDFTLMASADWSRLRGYPEFEAFSFHIDSLLVYAAHYSGVLEASLMAPAVAYHLEHSAGSGWTPEGADKLFERIERLGLPSMPFPFLLWILRKSRDSGELITFNREDWGMAAIALREFDLSGETMFEKPGASEETSDVAGPVAAIRDEWQYYKKFSEFLREQLDASQVGFSREPAQFVARVRAEGVRSLWRQRREVAARVVGITTAYISFLLRSRLPKLMSYSDRFRSRKT